MKTQNTNRKTTKTQLEQAVNAFRYTMDWVTGGTREETLRQAPTAVISLQEKADTVAALLLNLSKPALRDTWLCDYASRIPSMLQTYRQRYVAPQKMSAMDRLREKRRQAKSDAMVMRHANAGNTSVRWN
jgi:hypothetical protein